MVSKKNITIRDIAKMAGVSAGTVDRVLHNRGRVSEEALLKVNKVLEEINYKPNLIARTLGSNKNFRIAVLMPDPSQDPYWAQSKTGIRQAEIEWLHYNVSIDLHFFDLYDRKSFEEKATNAFLTQPDGILIAPIFYQETMPFFESFNGQAIPFVFFNTNIEGVHPLSFIGQNLYQSGRVAAELLDLKCDAPGKLVVLHVNEDSDNGVHLLEKERGFCDYFSGSDRKFEILSPKLNNSESMQFENQLRELFTDSQLKGAFITTSKGASIVAKFIEQNSIQGLTLVGYDMLQENLYYLKEGVIDFLIHQNPKQQAFLGINYLAYHLIFNKTAPTMSLLPLEILTKENHQSYIDAY